MMTRSQLTYFDMRGRAEAIRLFLHASSIDFEDERVTTDEGWTALKPTLPFGSLPIYQSKHHRLCESHAILRHLGREVGMNLDQRRMTDLDIAHDAFAEAQEDLWRFAWRPNYYDHLESYARDTLRPRLKKLGKWLDRERTDPNAWFGGAFSYVDCVAFCFLDEVDAFFPVVLDEFDSLAKLRRRVAADPKITDYMNSGRRPIVFGMGCMGPKVDSRMSREPGLRFANPWTAPIDIDAVVSSQRRLTAEAS
jgi:glutathione S-transferase